MEVESKEDGKMDEEAKPPTQLEPQSTKPEGEADAKVHAQAPLSAGVEVKACGVTHAPVIMEDELRPSPLPSPSKLSSVHREAEQCGTEDSVCKAEVGVSSCLLTPSASPGAAEERGMNGGVFVKSESSITNPVDWTVADVASYFTAAGFPEQALAFRMQEIDGKSLLLMQRNDVLTGLSIRLGPALKIYERHVKVLQRTHFQDDEAFC
ncbi:hypothetical protein PDJAM_G00162240 [Pangasius djambal]|uniref:Uncharacterized protein n=1 Tax=Pangasius djambal TaxID=1691987 RepID=A0ACC5ZK93_9TELE|nr:hypothetical protein [Pangasius djambal]